MGNSQSAEGRKQVEGLSHWIESSGFTVEEIQDALFNEVSLRVLLEKISVGNQQSKNKTSAPSLPQSIEYCLSAHQRHRLNASVAVTNALIEGGIVDKGNKEKSVIRLVEEISCARPFAPTFALTMESRLALIRASNPLVEKEAKMSSKPLVHFQETYAADASQINEFSLALLSELTSLYNFDDVEMMRTSLLLLENLLSSFTPLSLFNEWAPPAALPEIPVPMDIESAKATSSRDRKNSAQMALVDLTEKNYWATKRKAEASYWMANLAKSVGGASVTEPILICAIQLFWFEFCMPETVTVSIQSGGPSSEWKDIVTVSVNPSRFVKSNVQRISLSNVLATAIKVSMNGHYFQNTDGSYALYGVIPFTPSNEKIAHNVRRTILDLQDWMTGATSKESLFEKSLGNMLQIALISGSCTAFLKVILLLLKKAHEHPYKLFPWSIMKKIHSIRTEINAHILDQKNKIKSQTTELTSKKTSTTTEQLIEAAFDPTQMHEGIQLRNDNKTAHSAGGGSTHVCADIGFSGSGRYAWTIKIDEDNINDEMTCIGAALLPVTASSYEHSPELWMYRGYNGALYGRGTRVNPIPAYPKFHAGDLLRTELDLDEGTISYALNDEPLGVAFRNVEGKVFPAVAFYGSGRTVSLVKVESFNITEASSSRAPLCSLNEKKDSAKVGHGTFGKRSALGFDNKKISINGCFATEGLSLHAPGSVKYDLTERQWKTFEFTVGLNDSVGSKKITEVFFEILGDGKCLWKSTNFSRKNAKEKAKISVEGVKQLELKTHHVGPNNSNCHAVFFDAVLVAPEKENVLVDIDIAPSDAVELDLNAIIMQVVNQIVSDLHRVGKMYEETKKNKKGDDASNDLVYSLQKPFGIDVYGETFNLISSCLDVSLSALSNAAIPNQNKDMTDVKELYENIIIEFLGITKVNIGFLVESRVDPSNVQINLINDNMNSFSSLNTFLENIMNGQYSMRLKLAAVEVVFAGNELLYPTSVQRSELVLSLLNAYRKRKEVENSDLLAQHTLLLKLLEKFSSVPDKLVSLSSLQGGDDEGDDPKSSCISQLLKVLFFVVIEGSEDTFANFSPKKEIILNSEELGAPILKSCNILLRVFQRHLLSSAAFLKEDEVPNQFFIMYCEYVIVTGIKLLTSADEKLSQFNRGKEDITNTVVAALQRGVIGHLLPTFLSTLSLFSKNTFICQIILPLVSRLLRVLDAFNNKLEEVQNAENILRSHETRSWEKESGAGSLHNIMHQLYVGDRDNMDGQIGYEFETKKAFSIRALGRAVNSKFNDGQLVSSHMIRLWDSQSRNILAETLIDNNSPRDALGYAYNRLPATIQLQEGQKYRVTSQEFKGSGDPWYDREQKGREKYDTPLIRILRDIHAPLNSTAAQDVNKAVFPTESQHRNTGYGMVTFYIEQFQFDVEENPSHRFKASLTDPNIKLTCHERKIEIDKLDDKKKYEEWSRSATSGGWSSGVHSWDVIVNSANEKLNQEAVIGFSCGSNWERGHVMLGLADSEWGISTRGSLIHKMPNSETFDFPNFCPPITEGALVHFVLDVDAGTLKISVDSKNYGLAFGPVGSGASVESQISSTGTRVVLAASIRGEGVSITLHYIPPVLSVHWLLDLEKTLASLCGRMASSMIAGPSITDDEHELGPWLRSSLVGGGLNWYKIKESSIFNGQKSAPLPLFESLYSKDLDSILSSSTEATSIATEVSATKRNSIKGPGVTPLVIPMVKSATWSPATPLSNKLQSPFSSSTPKATSNKESMEVVERIISVEKGAIFLTWLESKEPESKFVRRLGTFPECEHPLLASCIHHSGSWKEVSGILNKLDGGIDGKDIEASPDMLKIWKRIVELRVFLRNEKSIFKQKEDFPEENETKEDFAAGEEKKEDDDAKKSSNNEEKKKDIINGDNKSSPKTFVELLEQVKTRCQFMALYLEQSVLVTNQESDPALNNLAEKFGVNAPGNSLEPISLNRFHSAKMSNSDKWGGVVSVLKAQRKLKRTKSTTGSSIIGDDAGELETSVIEGENEDYESQLSSTEIAAKACLFYAQHGATAAPQTIVDMISRRCRRAEFRVWGLHAFRRVLRNITFASAQQDALLWLRPAFRGSDGPSDEEHHTNIASIRHHYNKGLAGCDATTLDSVQDAFQDLFTDLASTLIAVAKRCDLALGHAAMWAWALDFEDYDHSFMLRADIVSSLKGIVSLDTLAAHARTVLDDEAASSVNRGENEIAEVNVIRSWKAWPSHYVREALKNGTLSKRELIMHIKSSPPGIIPDSKWWSSKNVKLDGTARDAVYTHNTESLLAVYEDFLSKSSSTSGIDRNNASFEENPLSVDRSRPILLSKNSSQGPGRTNLVRVKTGELLGETALTSESLGSSIHANSSFEFRQLRVCAWSLFRLIATLALGGSTGRREAEATQAAMATSRALKKAQHSVEVDSVYPPNAPDSPIRSPRKLPVDGNKKEENPNNLLHSIFLAIEHEIEMAAAFISNNGDDGWADIEPMEVEVMLYKQLLFLRSASDTALCQKYLSRPKLLQNLLIVQKEGSPRCINLALRLLRSFLSNLSPNQVNEALCRAMLSDDSEGVDFVNLLLKDIGQVLVVDTVFYGGEKIPGAKHIGYGSGHTSLVMTAERISLLRVLISEQKWKDYVVQEVVNAVKEGYAALDDAGIFSGPVPLTFNDKILKDPLSKLLAALSLLGGHIDLLRVGGRVEMIGEGGNVFGTLLRYSRGVSESLVAFGNSAAALPHEVNVESLAAVDELQAIGSMLDFNQHIEVLTAFLHFIKIDIEAPPESESEEEAVPVKTQKSAPIVLKEEPKKEIPNDWSCVICTFINSSDITVCGVCYADKENPPEDENYGVGELPKVETSSSISVEPVVSPVEVPETSLDDNAPVCDVALWIILLKCMALRSLDKLLAHEPNTVASLNVGLQTALFDAALAPISLKTFVNIKALEERASIVHERLLEMNAVEGNLLHAEVGVISPEVAAKIEQEARKVAEEEAKRLSLEESKKAADSLRAAMTPEQVARREIATNLSALGYDLDLCVVALERNENDPNRAAEWLMIGGPAVDTARRELEERGLGGPTVPDEIVKMDEEEEVVVDVTSNRWDAARKFADVMGLPETVTYKILEINNDDLNNAGDWIFSNGKYLETVQSEALDDIVSRVSDADQDDAAALEDIGESEALIRESSADVEDAVGDVTHGSKSFRGAPEVILTKVYMNEDGSTLLKSGMLVTVSENVGSMAILSGLTGIIALDDDVASVRKKANDDVVIKVLTEGTGFAVQHTVPLENIRIHDKFYGKKIKHISDVRLLLASTYAALATQYARVALVSLLLAWPQSIHFDLLAVGGAAKFTDLIKLVAASEDTFGRNVKKITSGGKLNLMDTLRGQLKNILLKETFDISSRSGPHISEESLAGVLLNQCVTNFVFSTQSNDAEKAVTLESFHPYFGKCSYKGEARIKGAKSLRVSFDPRSCTHETNASLTFYNDPECDSRIVGFSGPSSNFKPFIVHSDKLFFKFVSNSSADNVNEGWGYKFAVSTLKRSQWTNELQVLNEPSLDWACWLLDFLLNEVPELVATGAVHSVLVFNALVSYLRSPGSPYKHRVVLMLTQLMKSPYLFKEGDGSPDLSMLIGIGVLVQKRCLTEKDAGHLFLPNGLLQLVELTLTSKAASRAILSGKKDEQSLVPFDAVKTAKEGLNPPFNVIISKGDISADQKLMDVMDIADCLLLGTRLEDRLFCEAWLISHGDCVSKESAHPYQLTEVITGEIYVAGATSLVITLDSRCETKIEHSLSIQGGTSILTYSGPVGNERWPSAPINITGDKFTYKFDATVPSTNTSAGLWGFAFTVNALGLVDEDRAARLKKSIPFVQDCLIQNAEWTSEMDTELIEWVNLKVERGDLVLTSLSPADIRLSLKDFDMVYQSLGTASGLNSIYTRFGVLRLFNNRLKDCLELIDVGNTESSWSLGYKLRQLGHVIFHDIKLKLLKSAIEKTKISGGSNLNITLDNVRALQSMDAGECDPAVSQCIFVQAFRQLQEKKVKFLRAELDEKGRLFGVKFSSEEGTDWGGVFREGLSRLVEDLFSKHFNLLIPCPNAAHEADVNLDKYVPNPKHTSPLAIQMFEFVGKIMGISLRNNLTLPFDFPSIVWKKLVGQPVDVSDLEAIDVMAVKSLKTIRNCDDPGVDMVAIAEAEDFAIAYPDLCYVTNDSEGDEVELLPGGRDVPVTFHNRIHYCNMSEEYRLHEFDLQVAGIYRGFTSIIPSRALKLFTWSELEILVAGRPEIDTAFLRERTVYDGYGKDHAVVQRFWRVFESLSDDEKSKFIRFTWGRSRLPTNKEWSKPFKIQRRNVETTQLPVAHTCFFSVELPPYETDDIMKHRLLACIHFGVAGILNA